MVDVGESTRSQGTGPARRRNRRGNGGKLREDLLAAAEQLTAEAGDTRALSLRAVAASAGVAPTSVYLHFPDLGALKVALAQRFFAQFAAARSAAQSNDNDPVRALIAGCNAYAEFGLGHPSAYRLMFGAELPALNRSQASDTPSRAAFDALIASVRRCQEAGAAPRDTDPVKLATLLWSSLHGQVSLRIDRPEAGWDPIAETVQELVTRLLRLPVGD